MKVWRLEDVHHHGFYRAVVERFGDGVVADGVVDEAITGVGPTPPPWADGMSFWSIAEGYAFGFKSTVDLVRWFGTDARAIARTGVCVTVWDVPDDAVDVGGHQVAFNWRRATLLSVSTVEDFFATEGVSK